MAFPDTGSTSSRDGSPVPRPRTLRPEERLRRRAERLAQSGDFSQAIVHLELAVAAGADASECYLRIAEHQRTLANLPEAMLAAEKSLALAPDRLSTYEAVAAIALEMGDYQRAIEVSNALIKLSPRHIPAYSALGAAYIQIGDVDAAMRVTNTLIRLDPESPSHHFKKALLCQHKNEVALAVHEFMQAIRMDPASPHAEAALEALETLDSFQLNHIITLAMEDAVFRAKMTRDPVNAVIERGFALSDFGNEALLELTQQLLLEQLPNLRPLRYN